MGGNGLERDRQKISFINSETGDCDYEDQGKRPSSCPNNPFKNPEGYYKPTICEGCPADEQAWQSAHSKPPGVYIEALKERGIIVQVVFKQEITSQINPIKQ